MQSSTIDLLDAIRDSSFHFNSNGLLIVENANLFACSNMSRDLLTEILSEIEKRYHGDDVDTEISRCVYILKLASLSMSGYLQLNGQKRSPALSFRDEGEFWRVWIETRHLLSIIHNIFDSKMETFPLVWKKFALDLGYVFLSNSLDFSDNSLGFKAPLSPSDTSLIFLVSKYLESFMVTFPAYYPFMPEKYFSEVRWPVSVAESCSGKVHSLFRFLQSSDTFKTEEVTDLEEELPPVLTESTPRYCNYEYTRRQPWGGKFSSIQIMGLAQEILESLNINLYSANAKSEEPQIYEKNLKMEENVEKQMYANEEELNQCLLTLKGVVERVKRVDPSLLYRDKSKAPIFYEENGCHICCQPVASFFDRVNPFSKLSSSTPNRDNMTSSISTSSYVPKKVLVARVNTIDVRPQSTQELKRSAVVQQRHHCRLCLHAICNDCCAKDKFVGDKICLQCHNLVDILGLSNLEEKKPKKKSIFNFSEIQTSQQVDPDVTSAQVNDLASLVISSSNFVENEEEEYIPSLCCSVYMSASLKDWRDRDDDN